LLAQEKHGNNEPQVVFASERRVCWVAFAPPPVVVDKVWIAAPEKAPEWNWQQFHQMKHPGPITSWCGF
jgi:hypothetical protein